MVMTTCAQKYFFNYLKQILLQHDFVLTIIVLDLVSQVRDAILMNVYLEGRNPGESGNWNWGYMSKGRELGRSVYKQSETRVDGSCHSKEGSK
jgi:hypothetical protein